MGRKSHSDSLQKPPLIQCSAKNCSSNSKDEPNKCFFNFPPCEHSSEKSVERCKLWVMRSGNIQLLQYKSCELNEYCYICSNHFGSDQFRSAQGSEKVLIEEAVPSEFSCDPLTEEEMKIFPVPSIDYYEKELSPTKVTVSVTSPPQNSKRDSDSSSIMASIERVVFKTQTEISEISSDTDEKKTRTTSVMKDSESLNQQNDSTGDVDEISPEGRTSSNSSNGRFQSPRKKRCTPSRKAKQEAVVKLKASQQLLKETDDSDSKGINVKAKSDLESADNSDNHELKDDNHTVENDDVVYKEIGSQDSSVPDFNGLKQGAKSDAVTTGSSVSLHTDETESKGSKIVAKSILNVRDTKRSVLKGAKHIAKTRTLVKGIVPLDNDKSESKRSKRFAKSYTLAEDSVSLDADHDNSEVTRRRYEVLHDPSAADKKELKVAKREANNSMDAVNADSSDSDEPQIKKVAKTDIVAKNVVSKLGIVSSVAHSNLKQKMSPGKLVYKRIDEKTGRPLGANCIYFSKVSHNKTVSPSSGVMSVPVHPGNKSAGTWAKSFGGKSFLIKTNGGYSAPVKHDYSVIPVTRTTSTQTISNGSHGKPRIIETIDCDEKLSLICGISSFDILDNITDSTLKLVMSNTAMINDIEPTLREWIIMTCSKFMLRLSLEVLAVLFEMDHDKCSRIVEKTCIFLRKTLALPECQKYVWSLPSEVLDGIADFSDGIFTDNQQSYSSTVT